MDGILPEFYQHNEERLPIDFTVRDIPEQCRTCPNRAVRMMLGEHTSGPDLNTQIVSDTVREMQSCTTGLLEQYVQETVSSERPYWHGSDVYLPRDGFVGNGTKYVKTDKGKPLTTIEIHDVVTDSIEEVCGLEANTELLVNKKLRQKVRRQQKSHEELLRDIELATNPTKNMTAGRGDGLVALMMRNNPPKRNGMHFLESYVDEVNAARVRFGMLAVLPTAEIYRSFGLTPPAKHTISRT